MIRVLVARHVGSPQELADFDFAVVDGVVVKSRDGTRLSETVDLDDFLHEIARENPGRAADVEVTRR